MWKDTASLRAWADHPMTVCAYPGCGNGRQSGHALYRVSRTGPGMRFVGLCRDHCPDSIRPPPGEDVAAILEADNLDRLMGEGR